ncbi:DUF2591 family protein [Xenorhabdus nematophila]|uniref:phage protein NinX family protein n=1 Tax=Xenorhabdus nematophila TaxID=628 RepID=UPI0005436F77|nr:phage protein NinX family protein [Xenorhabdus nematophila]CEF32169.1 conserved hypothetical protein [Xenorhabdus nematophila str. Websteri]AYA39920.1 DUF2591 domain-containing protein [Xenorhabdus nematophila]MBA0018488.1 DUF2591 family protein [Xenorhabdus nematophila]MCB4424823.1 DUF2591 domain-containing protein [Xenorhabdus nematophila]QNJ37562.1 DUF2591 family protein [Xenorhabdus nematophila]
MKIKTSELTGRALDWSVAMAIGAKEEIISKERIWLKLSNGYYYVSNRGLYNFEPSNNWIQCGKLIEEYKWI